MRAFLREMVGEVLVIKPLYSVRLACFAITSQRVDEADVGNRTALEACSESCKQFISWFPVVLGQELVLQNVLPLELIDLIFVHNRSLFFCADVLDKSPQWRTKIPSSLHAINLHKDATNNQSQSTCPRHL